VTDTRFMGDLLGSYVLASRALTVDAPKVFACRARSISIREVVLNAPVIGTPGEKLSMAFQELGKLRATVTRRLNAGFAAELELDSGEADALAARISWLKRHSLRVVEDRREHKRVLPGDPAATLVLGQGRTMDCMIIDMSRSGVAVSADIMLRPGALVAVGSVPGRVVRHLESGFALQFIELQTLETLEGRLTLKTATQRTDAARNLGMLSDKASA
jgi:hypothetical protein